MDLVAGRQLLPGEIRQAGPTDAAAVAGPIFLSQGDFPATQGAAQAIPPSAALGVQQKRTSSKKREIEKKILTNPKHSGNINPAVGTATSLV